MHSTLPAMAPVDMVMPQLAQRWMTYANWGLVVVALLVALAYLRSRGSALGIVFILGGALTVLNEPIVDVLAKCWFPSVGSDVLLQAWGFSIPGFMLPTYAWYVGGQAFYSYQLFARGITVRGVFVLYAAYALVNVLLEVPALNLPQPLYTYYGNQPWVIAKFPMWWTLCNALMPMAMAAAVFRLESLLRGVRRLLVIPLAWMTAAAANGLVATPVWVALNVQGNTVGLTSLAAAVSLGMGLMSCYGLSLLVAIDVPVVQSARIVA